MSRLASGLGLLLGLLIIMLSMVDFETGKLLSAFFNIQAFLVVVGGTFAAAMINYPLSQLKLFFIGFKIIFTKEVISEDEVVEDILDLSRLAKSSSLLEIEKHIEQQTDPFLQFSLSEMMIYNNLENLNESLQNHLTAMRLRHLRTQDIFNNMATYAPAFGMMGTVMGLIIMMTAQVGVENSDVVLGEGKNMLDSLLEGMGLALVTTFYGVFIANFIFIPVSGKLKVLSDAEAVKNEIIIQGVLGIKQNMSTLILRDAMLAHKNYQAKLLLEQSVF